MSYQQFAAQMKYLIETMLTYETNQIGNQIYAEKCSELEDSNPEFAARFDASI